MAFTLLSGARDDAIASLRLKHVNLARRTVFQDARQVRTKNRKTFTSWFFPVGADIEKIATDWIEYLIAQKHFDPEDPVFPATKVALDQNHLFSSSGIGRRHWSNADAIRRVFRTAFAAVKLPYANPHSFRNTLTRLGEQLCRSPEEFKAWSQNLGHERVMTTLTSYGEVANDRQGEVMNGMRDRLDGNGSKRMGDPDAETIASVVAYLQRRAS